MSGYLSHEDALRASIRARIFVVVGLIPLFELTASCVLYWANRPEPGATLRPTAAARAIAVASKPVAQAPASVSLTAVPHTATENPSAECAECTLRGVTERLADRLTPNFTTFRAALQDQSVLQGDKGYATLTQLLAAAKAA